MRKILNYIIIGTPVKAGGASYKIYKKATLAREHIFPRKGWEILNKKAEGELLFKKFKAKE